MGKRHQQQHGSAAAAKRSKKGNKKKAAAHKSILKLLRELPDDIKREWATANELRDRLVDGGANNGITVADVCDVFGKLDRGVTFACRGFDENNTKYYRHQSFDCINATPQNRQHSHYVLPPIAKDYFLQRDDFRNNLEAIKEYVNSFNFSLHTS
jgi:hypothetical protein